MDPNAAVPAPALQIVEVSPRDGLQNEKALVTTDDKLRLVEALVASGVRRIEATSFVSPTRVPQMADAEAVSARLPRDQGVSWIGLVLNERGLDRALAAGLDEANVVVVATETFSQRNQGVGVADGIAAWSRIAARARQAGLRTTVTVAASFGCPFEGQVSAERIRTILEQCVQAQPDEVALADTIGCGVPAQVRELADVAADVAPGVPLRWHFHNTRNTGYANALVAAEDAARRGIPVALDASAGGIGGCPFAPRATGNIATEDLVYLLERSGLRTGVDLAPLLPLEPWLGELLGHQVPGQLARAGVFPGSASDSSGLSAATA
ncbi:MAG: hydroxymethylglutaryl-CoA lyase [Actinomycetales bacterium]